MFYQKHENEKKQESTICEQQNAVLTKRIAPRENSGRKVQVINRSNVFFLFLKYIDLRHTLHELIISAT